MGRTQNARKSASSRRRLQASLGVFTQPVKAALLSPSLHSYGLAPKARLIPDWGNAPGQMSANELRAEGPFYLSEKG